MSRIVTIGAAQSGPILREESRSAVVERQIQQLREAHRQGCDLVVFPEVALTAFFPHWWIEDEAELDAWFEREMPGPETQPLFDEAARLGIGFHLGYAELTFEGGKKRRFNSAILVGKDGQKIGHFRKIHLPGHVEYRPDNPFQNLEKRYFEFGDRPFETWRAFGGVVGIQICNDRRWSESYRLLALKGAELVLIGYNTPDHIPEHPHMDRLTNFQHQLCMQSGAYQNACWIVAVAKAGIEEGVSMIGLSSIIAPSGEIVAQTKTLGDELIVHACDLDDSKAYQELFEFGTNRRIQHYGPIATQAAAVPPP
ncbi:MAG: N-carbamoyl-D-amino-acid hydrolase [Planctomycetaceae bacterium]|nr:N-carbamoyl-D-amino-acid hydrolase [Planctomycetaceae bacterium]